MKTISAALAALLLFAPAALASTSRPATPPDAAPSPQGRVVLPAEVTPDAYDIAVEPDAKALTFKGQVRIVVSVHAPTSRIVLNAADIGFDRVVLEGRKAAPAVSLDVARQTATFAFARPVEPGRYTLDIAYHGKIYQQASGFFALDYATPHGKARALFTQFENSDARRFVPCWDEPGRKARFQLTVAAPADEMAVSNMPVASSEPMAGGLKRVRFAETPKMSSYLLFLGIGDFERISRQVDGVDVGVIVKRGDSAEARFALDAASQILPYYDSYFGVKYPLPKLDMIAGPGVSQFFGAMENWGAIFYFERDLLIDPRIATEDDRQNAYITIAHEMAHQWFGDLVTMAWWDDIWLNEGFASWMENKVTDHFHPEWKVWLQELQSKQGAMQVDARAGTHPIIQPIPDILEASNAFDDITYEKGAAVIRMLEAYAGPDAWRDGVRRYISAHAYANAVTDDLWREVDAVTPHKITAIAHDFTLQAGVPMIEVAQSDCKGHVLNSTLGLAQVRFGLDAKDKILRAWRTPVSLATVGGGQEKSLVTKPGAVNAVSVIGCGPLVVNAGQTGYFRTLYDAASMDRITASYPRLSPDDQLGVLNDTASEAYAGYSPMAGFLDVAVRLPDDADPVLWQALANRLEGLDRLYDGLPGQTGFRAWARSRLAPVLARLGWADRPGEPANTSGERIAVITALGRMDDPGVVAEARRRFQSMQTGGKLDPATRAAVLTIVAQHADPATWESLHALARNAKSDLEKREFYDLLGRAHDEALARRALDLAVSGEPEPTTAPGIIRAVGSDHPLMALDFTADHWSQIEPKLESTFHDAFAPRVVSSASDLQGVRRLDAFAAAHPFPGSQEVAKTEAAIRFNAMVRSQRLPEVDQWLKAHPGG